MKTVLTPNVERVCKLARELSGSGFAALVTGQNGVGKSTAALQAIRELSRQPDAPRHHVEIHPSSRPVEVLQAVFRRVAGLGPETWLSSDVNLLLERIAGSIGGSDTDLLVVDFDGEPSPTSLDPLLSLVMRSRKTRPVGLLVCAPANRSLFGSLPLRTHNALLTTETLKPFEKPSQVVGFLRAQEEAFTPLDEACKREEIPALKLAKELLRLTRGLPGECAKVVFRLQVLGKPFSLEAISKAAGVGAE